MARARLGQRRWAGLAGLAGRDTERQQAVRPARALYSARLVRALRTPCVRHRTGATATRAQRVAGRRYHWHPRVLHAPLRLSKGYEQGSVTNSSPRVPLCGTLPGHSILSGGGTGDQPEMPMAVSGWSPMAADGTWGNKLAEDLFPAPPSGLRFHYSVVYTRLATQTHSACPLSISLFYVSAGERSIGFGRFSLGSSSGLPLVLVQ